MGRGTRAAGAAKAATPSNPNDRATRDRVIAATVDCIRQRGFYRASTNEIARSAGVTWGVIQHYFGTRETLMLSVLEDGANRFVELVEGVHLDGDTVPARLDQLIDTLVAHYARPEFLVYLQILLSMDGDPRTGPEVRRTMRELAERSNIHVRRLLRECLGPTTGSNDLTTTLFLILRGFGVSQQLFDTMAFDALAPKQDRVLRQRRLLSAILTPYLEGTAAE